MSRIADLLAKLNVEALSLPLYELALTHPSYHAEEHDCQGDYERLEFMGDAIISLVVATLIFKHHPQADQGLMSKMRAKLVQTDNLFRLAQQLELAKYVKIGPSITKDIVASSKKIMEDMFEALIGAIYIDHGFAIAEEVITSLFASSIESIDIASLTDYKTQLQEAIQAEHRESVTYFVDSESGPAHDRHFTVSVSFGGTVLGRGSGSSKKLAEQKAAEDALKKKAG